ncbi:MAG: hypothetical protein JWN39_667, partial [Ilumatobacteraceae bacterium]|nr:hypothetical protein [Ilumatobacteraceae bacterium]
PTSGRSDRSGEDGKGVETALSSPGPLPPATELDALPAAGIEAETHDAMDMGRAWIDDGAEPVDDLWDVAQSPPVRARGPIVPLEIVIPIVVLALLIVVFVSWTS